MHARRDVQQAEQFAASCSQAIPARSGAAHVRRKAWAVLLAERLVAMAAVECPPAVQEGTYGKTAVCYGAGRSSPRLAFGCTALAAGFTIAACS